VLRVTVIAAALLALALAPAPVHAHASARSCGLTKRIDGVRYDVREVRGTVSCRTVKRVVTRFLRGDTPQRPWFCARGHGSSPFAASCSRGKRVLVRVYAPS
jgi:hypothetical protein